MTQFYFQIRIMFRGLKTITKGTFKIPKQLPTLAWLGWLRRAFADTLGIVIVNDKMSNNQKRSIIIVNHFHSGLNVYLHACIGSLFTFTTLTLNVSRKLLVRLRWVIIKTNIGFESNIYGILGELLLQTLLVFCYRAQFGWPIRTRAFKRAGQSDL